MPPTAQDRLQDVLDSIVEIEGILDGFDFERFLSDRRTRLMVERLLEIVCEATRNLPAQIKEQAQTIAWQRIIDFGNHLRHAYHETDPDRVWDVVQSHLPRLKAFAEHHIKAQ